MKSVYATISKVMYVFITSGYLWSCFQVNTLSREFNAEVEQVMSDVLVNDGVKGIVVISSKPDCFIAGADIK